jgi:hypothetical protein
VTLQSRLVDGNCRTVIKARSYSDHITLLYGHTFDGQTMPPGWVLSGCVSNTVSDQVQAQIDNAVSKHGTSRALGVVNNQLYESAIVRANKSGSVNSENFQEFLLQIILTAFPDVSPDKPETNLVVFLDGLNSRLSDGFIKAMADRGIHIIFWPSHCTSRFQTPDVIIFGLLKPIMTKLKSNCQATQGMQGSLRNRCNSLR